MKNDSPGLITISEYFSFGKLPFMIFLKSRNPSIGYCSGFPPSPPRAAPARCSGAVSEPQMTVRLSWFGKALQNLWKSEVDWKQDSWRTQIWFGYLLHNIEYQGLAWNIQGFERDSLKKVLSKSKLNLQFPAVSLPRMQHFHQVWHIRCEYHRPFLCPTWYGCHRSPVIWMMEEYELPLHQRNMFVSPIYHLF